MKYRVVFRLANSWREWRTEWFASKDDAGHFMSLAANMDVGSVYVIRLETGGEA